MDTQLSLFENDTFENQLESMLKQLTVKWEYYPDIFSLSKRYSKKGKNAGNLISTSLEINEKSYPYDVNNKISKTTSVLLIYPMKTMYKIQITASCFDNIPLPSTAQIKKTTKPSNNYIQILFKLNDENIFEYITEALKYSLENYCSASTFGCCAKYKECSTSGYCVHSNKLYAKGCQYRQNLEKGNIFF